MGPRDSVSSRASMTSPPGPPMPQQAAPSSPLPSALRAYSPLEQKAPSHPQPDDRNSQDCLRLGVRNPLMDIIPTSGAQATSPGKPSVGTTLPSLLPTNPLTTNHEVSCEESMAGIAQEDEKEVTVCQFIPESICNLGKECDLSGLGDAGSSRGSDEDIHMGKTEVNQEILRCNVKDFSAVERRKQKTLESFMCEIETCKYSSKQHYNLIRHIEKKHAGHLPPFKKKCTKEKYVLLNSKLQTVFKKIQRIVFKSRKSKDFKNWFRKIKEPALSSSLQKNVWSVCDLKENQIWVGKQVVQKCSMCRVASSILHEIVHLHSENVRCGCSTCGNKADSSWIQSVAEVSTLDIPAFVLGDITETDILPYDIQSEICLNQEKCIFCVDLDCKSE